jgi:glycosyltransferase involved in cell wall biosynthesis
MTHAGAIRRTFADRLFAFVVDRSGEAGLRGGSPLRKIAVLLPIAYRGGSLRGFKTIAKMLRKGSMAAGEPVEIVAAFPASSYDERQDFTDLTEAGIPLRPFAWKFLDRATLARALGFVSDERPALSEFPESIVPDDGINNLLDCDFWLVVSDRLRHPLAPLRPAGFMIYDYIQRMRPDVFTSGFDDGPFVSNVRRGEFVLCTTPFTADAAVAYAGVPRSRVHLVDMEIETDLDDRSEGGQVQGSKRPYMLWPCNSSPHKNQLAALDALEIYFTRHSGALDVVCSGANTDWFDLRAPPIAEHDYPAIEAVRHRIARSPLLRKRVHMVGELLEADYFATLAGARFLFHPALVDNGTFAVTEAAWFEVPSLSHDYPAIRWMDERFGLALAWCDARDPLQTAGALAEMERVAPLRKTLLPSRDMLRRHGWANHSTEFWKTVSGLMSRSKRAA